MACSEFFTLKQIKGVEEAFGRQYRGEMTSFLQKRLAQWHPDRIRYAVERLQEGWDRQGLPVYSHWVKSTEGWRPPQVDAREAKWCATCEGTGWVVALRWVRGKEGRWASRCGNCENEQPPMPGPCTPERAVQIRRGLAAAMDFCQEHRDMEENILTEHVLDAFAALDLRVDAQDGFLVGEYVAGLKRPVSRLSGRLSFRSILANDLELGRAGQPTPISALLSSSVMGGPASTAIAAEPSPRSSATISSPGGGAGETSPETASPSAGPATTGQPATSQDSEDW